MTRIQSGCPERQELLHPRNNAVLRVNETGPQDSCQVFTPSCGSTSHHGFGPRHDEPQTLPSLVRYSAEGSYQLSPEVANRVKAVKANHKPDLTMIGLRVSGLLVLVILVLGGLFKLLHG